ncbi:MAG: 3'-5' exonuclease [Phascolarctobacterium sp.]|nr:3'-5' exonuclease [Phascolarctobacterium sp.]
MDLLNKLNTAQREAVTTTEGYVRVIAGAGSGKTRALSHRFAYLVNELGIMPKNILCVTFTNKAANEMKRRIHKLTGDNDTGYVNTFHGFCVSVLQEDSHAVQYPKSFMVLDNNDIDDMLKIIYEERGLTLHNMTFSKARDMIEIRKLYKDPEYYKDMIAMSIEALEQKYLEATNTDDIIFFGYLYQEKKCFGLDYNDLINFTLYIFETNVDIRLKWQERLEYIMIDEFQDIDELQYKLMQVLCAYHNNLFVVGDPDQTIYTWRGARISYLKDFDKSFPDVKTIMMLDNYRSTPEILAVSNNLLIKNSDRIVKELVPKLASGQPVLYFHSENVQKECAWLIAEMQKLHKAGVRYKEITVLYRAHYVTRGIEDILLKEKIPYVIYSGVRFFDRMEIKDVLSYLRMIAFQDDLSFRRIVNLPKRNLGERRIKFLEECAEKDHCSLYEAMRKNIDNEIFKRTKAKEFVSLIDFYSRTCFEQSISELLNKVLDKSGYEEYLRTLGSQERLDNLAELKQSIYEYETTCGEECTLEHYLNHVALYTNTDLETEGDKVKLMTIHAAKGLEFPYVFLCELNEGIFPSSHVKTCQAMEEERRLAYVAMTRAEKGLYLSEAAGRNIDNSYRYPSRFVLEIDKSLLSYVVEINPELIKEAESRIAFSDKLLVDEKISSSFKVGDRVIHSVFGPGTMISNDEDNKVYVIKFDKLPTNRSLKAYVKLELEK